MGPVSSIFSFSLQQSASQGLHGQSNILLEICFQKTSAPELEIRHQGKHVKFINYFFFTFLIDGFYFSLLQPQRKHPSILSDSWKFGPTKHVLVHSTKGAYWKCSGLDTSVSSPEYSFELETHKKFTSQECTWLPFRYTKAIPLVLMNPWNLPGSCVDSKWFARTHSIQWSQNIKSAQASLVEVWHPFLTLRNHHLHSGLEHQKLCELLIPFLPVHFILNIGVDTQANSTV